MPIGKKSPLLLFSRQPFGCCLPSYSASNPHRSITVSLALSLFRCRYRRLQCESNKWGGKQRRRWSFFFLSLFILYSIAIVWQRDLLFPYASLLLTWYIYPVYPGATPLGKSLIDPFPSISFDRWQPTAWRSDAASCVFRGLPPRLSCYTSYFFFLSCLFFFFGPVVFFYASRSPFPALNSIKSDCVYPPLDPRNQWNIFVLFFFTRQDPTLHSDTTVFLYSFFSPLNLCLFKYKNVFVFGFWFFGKKEKGTPRLSGTVRFLSLFFCVCFVTNSNFTFGRVLFRQVRLCVQEVRV